MEIKGKEELEALLLKLRKGELVGRDVYRAIQTFGENGFIEARQEIEQFLSNEDDELRFVSLKVLTRYFLLDDHWETAKNVLENDPEVDCRFRAATDLGALRRNTQDAITLRVLASVVCNEKEDIIVRESAYAAMRSVIQYDPREQISMSSRKFDLNRDADWDMVKSYL